jgi:hypothetical protein
MSGAVVEPAVSGRDALTEAKNTLNTETDEA